ncbi:fluoride efflux transporter FluC [Microbacterium sp. ASV49]|uniref:Fluoride-specific ion channel FluC n=1 Tax=Microbacterium candidum TaxID=3041922 RepID=A0ABT7MTN3_9MICO|nr:CrcB family protein [Microbacterium sp. ASV49]MDL9977810.1 CrcB family protein [Microbacterium sp. ASV49]
MSDRPLHLRPRYLALVFAGGAAGTLLRWALALALPTGWPVATLIANVTGAFALGWLLEALALRSEDEAPGHSIRLLFGTGVLGGYTTYSAFAVDTDLLGFTWPALAYIGATIVLGAAASLAGIAIAARIGRRA